MEVMLTEENFVAAEKSLGKNKPDNRHPRNSAHSPHLAVAALMNGYRKLRLAGSLAASSQKTNNRWFYPIAIQHHRFI